MRTHRHKYKQIDGWPILIGNNTAWDDFSVPLVRGSQGQNDKPDYDYTNLGLLFPQNDAAEKIYLVFQMSHAKKLGTDIYLHLHFLQDEVALPTFKADYKFYNNGATYPTSFTTISTADGSKGVFDYTSGTKLQIATFPAIAAPENETVSANLDVIFYREDNDVTGDVLAKYLDYHFEIDTFGSSEQFSK